MVRRRLEPAIRVELEDSDARILSGGTVSYATRAGHSPVCCVAPEDVYRGWITPDMASPFEGVTWGW